MPTYVTSQDDAARERSGFMPLKSAALQEEVENKFDSAKLPMEQPFSPVAYPGTQAAALAESQEASEQDNSTEDETVHISTWTRCGAYLSLVVVATAAYTREAFRFLFLCLTGSRRGDYAPLVKDFDGFWNRRLYRRARDCWNRPIDSRPSRVIGVMERKSDDYNATFKMTGRIIPAVNLGSYNYLGFAEDTPSITHDVLDAIDDFGLSSGSSSREAGQSAILARLEDAVARFLGKEDAIVCGMGFGTNFSGLPALFGKGTLCISDHLNHSSIVNGVRSSGAKVNVFRHGDYDGLEKAVRDAVILGQDPKNNLTNYKPWERIVILVEGIYSMEGEIVDLQRVVEIKKKYGALVFVDEAHSIGAIGRTGRGVCEHCCVDPKDVDILMGTFTKSFGSIGGYIAGDKTVMDFIRMHGAIALHCDTLAPPCAQQVVSVLDVILGKDGTDLGQKRIAQLKENSHFFRQGLLKLGFHVLGDDASPVIPVMAYNMGKMPYLSRHCLKRGIAIVSVGYPATPLLESRIRFCVSAAHTREDLQYVLDVMKDMAEEIYLTYRTTNFFGMPITSKAKRN